MRSKNEPKLYIKVEGKYTLYVDDLIFNDNSAVLKDKFKEATETKFEITDLGIMHYFPGMEVHQVNGKFYFIF